MPRDWLPPPPPTGSPWWVLASVAVNVALVALVVVTTQRTFPNEPVIIVLDAGGAGGGAVEMPWESVTARRQDGRTAARAEGQEGGRAGAASTATTSPTPPTANREPPTEVAVGPPRPPGGEERGGGPPGVEGGREAGPPGVAEGRPGGRVLGARLGDGRLWVRPWDAIAAALAGSRYDSLDAVANAALLDSVIEARVTAFLQDLPPDSFATPRQPDWVTEINGQKWGIDGSWIYLGGLKIPSAILALIPLPEGGNYEGARRAAELQRIREDIMQSARRAESADQFKKYVKETRERRDAEREARKNQKVKPDSIKT